MKKKAPLVLSTALLLLATSSYTFSQPYVFRSPASGIKASLSSGGLPPLPDNGGNEREQCEPYEGEGGVIVFEADSSNEDAVNELKSFLSDMGIDYANPLLGVETELYSGIIDNEGAYRTGDYIPTPEGFLNKEFGLNLVDIKLYQLDICGEYVPENDPPIPENDPPIPENDPPIPENDPPIPENDPPITVNELEDILNKYDGKKRRNNEDKWLNRDGEYVEEFPGLDNWLPCGMHSDFYQWWNNNNYNNVYTILC